MKEIVTMRTRRALRRPAWALGARFGLSLVFMIGASVVDAADPPQSAVASAGEWRTEGRAARASQDWQLDVRRDGDKLTGTIILGDSPLARVGKVDAHIRGNIIRGSIRGEDGRHVARIFGQIDETGLRGTYRDRTGETGTWSAAALPSAGL